MTTIFARVAIRILKRFCSVISIDLVALANNFIELRNIFDL